MIKVQKNQNLVNLKNESEQLNNCDDLNNDEPSSTDENEYDDDVCYKSKFKALI